MPGLTCSCHKRGLFCTHLNVKLRYTKFKWIQAAPFNWLELLDEMVHNVLTLKFHNFTSFLFVTKELFSNNLIELFASIEYKEHICGPQHGVDETNKHDKLDMLWREVKNLTVEQDEIKDFGWLGLTCKQYSNYNYSLVKEIMLSSTYGANSQSM